MLSICCLSHSSRSSNRDTPGCTQKKYYVLVLWMLPSRVGGERFSRTSLKRTRCVVTCRTLARCFQVNSGPAFPTGSPIVGSRVSHEQSDATNIITSVWGARVRRHLRHRERAIFGPFCHLRDCFSAFTSSHLSLVMSRSIAMREELNLHLCSAYKTDGMRPPWNFLLLWCQSRTQRSMFLGWISIHLPVYQ